MRAGVASVVLALLASTTVAACGGSAQTDPSTTTPVKFSVTATVAVPTTTVPTPTSTPYIGPEGVPIETGPFLATATTTPLGRIVDGIQCQGIQQLAYALYVHLQVYVHGNSRAVPGGIGLVDPTAAATSRGLVFSPRTCYYWLHTRAADGVIDVESPQARVFTLGDFFKVWNQPLGGDRVATDRGKITAFVDGERWRGNPRQIPLTEHTSIELAVGRPVPPFRALDWTATGL